MVPISLTLNKREMLRCNDFDAVHEQSRVATDTSDTPRNIRDLMRVLNISQLQAAS